MRKARTQEALVAALRVRPRTTHGAAQRDPAAKVSFFSSLQARGRRSRANGAARSARPQGGPRDKVGEEGPSCRPDSCWSSYHLHPQNRGLT